MKRASMLLILWVVTSAASLVHALPVTVPNFAVDPTGPQIAITPVPITDPGSINLAAAPTLDFGITSEPDGTANTLRMTWEPLTANTSAQAGWQLDFIADPDLRNQQIILSIAPPGGWITPQGIPNAAPGAPNLFLGISSLQIRAIDNNGILAGGWGFNTDQAGLLAIGHDPAAAGGVSLLCNAMQTVTINVFNGPVPGSANVAGPLPPPIIAPNFLIAGNNNFANIKSLQFFENGILQGGVTVIPGQPLPGIKNYWDHITVTPEPASLTLLALAAGITLLRRHRR